MEKWKNIWRCNMINSKLVGLEELVNGKNVRGLASRQEEPVIYHPKSGSVNDVEQHHTDLREFNRLIDYKGINEHYSQVAFSQLQQRYGTDINETIRNLGIVRYHMEGYK